MASRSEGGEDHRVRDAWELLRTLDTVELGRYSVVGPYLRFGEQSRNALKELRVRLTQSLLSQSSAPQNLLL